MSFTSFTFNGDTYLPLIVSDTLGHSKMLTEIRDRGDQLAVRLRDNRLMVVKGTGHPEQEITFIKAQKEVETQEIGDTQINEQIDKEFYRNKLRAIVREARGALGE